jgi:hypothetical protein
MTNLRFISTAKTFTILFVFLIVSREVAVADYHFVSHQGSDEYPYTQWETASWFVQDAIDAANPGDTIYIDSGEWYESISNSSEDDSLIALIGAGMDQTRIYWDGHHQAVIYPGGDKGLLQGIHFDNTNDWPAIYAYYGGEGELVIKSCRLTGPQGIFMWKRIFEIINSIVEIYDHHAIHLENPSKVIIQNCIFHGTGYSGGIDFYSSNCSAEINNNIFTNIHWDAVDLGGCDSS